MPYPAASHGDTRLEDGGLPFGSIVREIQQCDAPAIAPVSVYALSPLLSPGDRVELQLNDGEEFTGVYAVGNDGHLRVPYLDPILVQGRSVATATSMIQ
ncbi:MAG: polysaccharide biosynthesis/export family protein, partial [Pseudomonadota bacterium]